MYTYTNHDHISAKRNKMFLPFQNGCQITYSRFASFLFRRKFEEQKYTHPKEFFNEICDVIKQNESELANTDFKI